MEKQKMDRKYLKHLKLIPIKLNKEIKVSDICTCPRYPNEYKIFGTFENSYINECKPYQLIAVSDDEIKEGDFYLSGKHEIYCVNNINAATKEFHKEFDNKKIIASYLVINDLPTFQKSFIKKWCENPIDECEVKYLVYNYNQEENWYLDLTEDNKIICSFVDLF